MHFELSTIGEKKPSLFSMIDIALVLHAELHAPQPVQGLIDSAKILFIIQLLSMLYRDSS